MPPWKQFLLTLYYHATYPARAWTHARLAAADRLPAIVLCWHRIADDGTNPWTVSNAAFARQIRWLSRRFQFVSLDEAQRRIGRKTGNGTGKGDSPHLPKRPEGCFAQMGTVPFSGRPCISVTFDDGYADNCRQAIPLLIRERIPCTYFVTAQNVVQEEPFAHDLAAGHRLAPNTLEQLRDMAAAGIEIGAHGYSHVDLGSLSDRGLLRREIVVAKEQLQRAVGRPVRYFAFPYGLYANLSSSGVRVGQGGRLCGRLLGLRRIQFPRRRPFPLATHRDRRRHDPPEELGHSGPAEAPHAAVRVPGISRQ